VRDRNELLQWWVIRKVVVVGGGSREKPSCEMAWVFFLSFFLSSGKNSEGGNLSSDIDIMAFVFTAAEIALAFLV